MPRRTTISCLERGRACFDGVYLAISAERHRELVCRHGGRDEPYLDA